MLTRSAITVAERCCSVCFPPWFSLPGISLWVNRRKTVVFVVQISVVVVSLMGAYVYLRVKCIHTPRVRTAYDMIHSYHSTTIRCNAVAQRRPEVFRSHVNTCFLATELAAHQYTKQRDSDFFTTRPLLTWASNSQLSSKYCPRTLLYSVSPEPTRVHRVLSLTSQRLRPKVERPQELLFRLARAGLS